MGPFQACRDFSRATAGKSTPRRKSVGTDATNSQPRSGVRMTGLTDSFFNFAPSRIPDNVRAWHEDRNHIPHKARGSPACFVRESASNCPTLRQGFAAVGGLLSRRSGRSGSASRAARGQWENDFLAAAIVRVIAAEVCRGGCGQRRRGECPPLWRSLAPLANYPEDRAESEAR